MTSPWTRSSLRGKATLRSRESSPFTPRQSLNYSSFISDSPRNQQKIASTAQLLEETPQRKVETFGLPLPVQISEALANRERNQHSSIRIDESGWAWLVTGRKLFVWRFVPVPGSKGMFCKELMLPATELYHMADLVCILVPPTSRGSSSLSGVSVIAVSPEGMVRHWPSLVHDSTAVDMATDLTGSQCYSLTAFQPYGCILMTTTNELMLLSSVQKTVRCQTLKTSSGMLFDLGRRMTSFIFGSQPSSGQVANWQKVLASNISADNSRELYVLSGNQLFKWRIMQAGSATVQEKLIFQAGLENLFREAAVQALPVNIQTAGQITVWCLDMALFNSQILVLAAIAVSGQQTTQLFYVLGAVKTDLPQSPAALESINVLHYSLTYEESNEQQLLDFKLLLPEQSSSAFIYDSNTVICVPVYRADSMLNKIDLHTPGDGILGSGLFEDKPLFFSVKHGVITVTVNSIDESDEVAVSRLETSQAKVVDMSLVDMTFGETDDDMKKFKTAFLQYCQGSLQESQAICSRLFPSSDSELDTAVLTLSQELIDDFPVSDPRWAESIPSGGISTSTSLIILHQLEDKLKAHSFMLDFLKGVGLWDKLGVVGAKEKPSLTCYLICEHAEKLSAAVALCKVDKTYQESLEESIGMVIKQRRAKSQFRGLTEQDLFFREVSRISDLFECLVEHEQDVFSRQQTPTSHLQTILAVNSIMQNMLQEAWHYRQSNHSAYQPTNQRPDLNIELIPWTATSGPSGLRSLLLKQIVLTAERGVAETDDQRMLSVFVQQMVDLADVLLDGYVYQIQSLWACPGKESRCDEVRQKYEQDRQAVIRPLVLLGKRPEAASLAEKYHDFGILIELCESNGDQDTLQTYVTKFTEQGFSDYLFKWYMDRGERHKLMTLPGPQHKDLARFLSSHHHLSWLHDIQTRSFYKAHDTLKGLACNETSYLGRKKTLLSLSKLALLTSEDFPNDGSVQLEDIINEHDIILQQETLPSVVLQRAGLDIESMPPLPPSDLIELHVGDQNPGANEYDFKKALDLLRLATASGRYDIDESSLKLHIWCKALLKDDWSSLPVKDPLSTARNTVFFRTVELAFNQGMNLTDFMPSLEALLETAELQAAGLSDNPQFRFLLKSGYEQIERATAAETA